MHAVQDELIYKIDAVSTSNIMDRNLAIHNVLFWMFSNENVYKIILSECLVTTSTVEQVAIVFNVNSECILNYEQFTSKDWLFRDIPLRGVKFVMVLPYLN